MRASLVLCDWAEVINGKIYIQGAGWSVILADNNEGQFAIALFVYLPYDLTNREHHVNISLITEDGQPYPPEDPIMFDFRFEMGRPPGMKRGQEQTLPFAAKLNGLAFAIGGYRWNVTVNDEIIEYASFQAAAALNK